MSTYAQDVKHLKVYCVFVADDFGGFGGFRTAAE